MRRALLRAAIGIWIGGSAAACRCEERNRPSGTEATCRQTCTKLAAAGCDAGLEINDRGRCESQCIRKTSEIEASGCTSTRLAWLDCVAKNGVDCAKTSSLSLEQNDGIIGCADAYEKYRACVAPCAFAGSIYQAEGIEVTRAGCGACPDLAKGAPAGSPCTAASVCAQSCCACAESKARFLVRACSGGTCADERRACDLGKASRAKACE